MVVKKKTKEPKILPGPCSERQEMYITSKADVTLYGGAAGGGKALRHGHKVLTAKGWKNIEDMLVGDVVITPKNKKEKVLGVFPQGIGDIYRVSFQDGSFLDVSGEHLWKVTIRGKNKPQLLNTLQLSDYPKTDSQGWKIHAKIDLVDGVEFEDKELPIHPYVLGAMIGDGSMSGSHCCLTSADQFIIDKFGELGYELKEYVGSSYGYGLLNSREQVKDLGLNTTSEFKFIPELYKNASLEQRYQLIQGLMDTDGTVCSTGVRMSFCTVSPQLAKDFQEVIRSLGGTATITEKDTFYNGKDGERVNCKKAYIIYIRHRDRSKLVSLPRKVERVVKFHKNLNNPVKGVVKLDEKDYSTCIAISGEEKQFITDNYLVSHNSEIGVIDFLKYTDIPNFIGVMTRRTTPQLYGPGNVLTKCKRIFGQAYEPDEFTWRAKDGKFVFHKSGAEIYLKHFENDQASDNWQGTEANLFYIDEGTQFNAFMIQYIMSRMRNPNCPSVQPHMKITCNPDRDHFLFDWVHPYLNEDGTPDRSKDGMIRYFTFYDGGFVFADNKEDLVKRFGLESEEDVLSFTFISATVNDNPILKKINPRYVSWLKGLSGVERQRLLLGNWKVRQEGSGFWKREWVHELAEEPCHKDIIRTVRAYDFAGNLVSDANPNPDYSASCKMSILKNGYYFIHEVERFRKRYGDHLGHIIANANKDGRKVDIIIPSDPNASAQAAARMMVRDIASEGYYAKAVKANKSKLDRFRPFSACSQNGDIYILENCGADHEAKQFNTNDWYYTELERFTGERDRSKEGHDD